MDNGTISQSVRPYRKDNYSKRFEYGRQYRLAHRRELALKQRIYYQNHKEYQAQTARTYQNLHKEKYAEFTKNSIIRLRTQVLTHYGNGQCACVLCGFSNIRALSIDHINGGGTRHRRILNNSSKAFYRQLIKDNFPKGYQTLCMNCQFIKRDSNNEYKKVDKKITIQSNNSSPKLFD